MDLDSFSEILVNVFFTIIVPEDSKELCKSVPVVKISAQILVRGKNVDETSHEIREHHDSRNQDECADTSLIVTSRSIVSKAYR